MQQKSKVFLKILISPAGIVFIGSLVLALFSLYMTYRIRPFTSDDISWQAILMHWRPFSGQHATLGSSDNFVDKLPFFMLFNDFMPSRRLILIESAILEAIGLSAFFAAAIYFLKRSGGKLSYSNLLPLVWLGSFGYAFTQLFLNSEWRGAETGLSFLLFAFVAAFYTGAKPLKSIPAKLLAVLLPVLAGIFTYSDPHFFYFAVVPLILFSGALFALKKINKAQAAVFAGAVLLSLVVAKLTKLVSVKAGLAVVDAYPVQFASFDGFLTNLRLATHGILLIFGADFFNRRVFSLGALTAVVNAALVGYIFYRLKPALQRSWTKRTALATFDIWKGFFAGLMLLFILFYTFSNVAIDLNTYRYFFMMVLTAVIFLVIDLGDTAAGFKKILAGVLILATLLNVVSSIKGDDNLAHVPAATNRANSANFALIQELQDRGLVKGYASYWDGVLNTYLSQDKINFLPAFCAKGRTVEYHWLVDEGRFKQSAARSFYVINPEFTVPPGCTKDQLEQQFGKPKEIIHLKQRTVLIYDYDIGRKM